MWNCYFYIFTFIIKVTHYRGDNDDTVGEYDRGIHNERTYYWYVCTDRMFDFFVIL